MIGALRISLKGFSGFVIVLEYELYELWAYVVEKFDLLLAFSSPKFVGVCKGDPTETCKEFIEVVLPPSKESNLFGLLKKTLLLMEGVASLETAKPGLFPMQGVASRETAKPLDMDSKDEG